MTTLGELQGRLATIFRASLSSRSVAKLKSTVLDEKLRNPALHSNKKIRHNWIRPIGQGLCLRRSVKQV
jgi:hypothetical protein